MKRLIVLASALLGLVGCAGSNYDIARRHDALRDYKGADAGFVVASAGGERGGRFDASGSLSSWPEARTWSTSASRCAG